MVIRMSSILNNYISRPPSDMQASRLELYCVSGMGGATDVPHIVKTLRVFWRQQQLCATSSLHVSRRANELHNMLVIVTTPVCRCTYPGSPRAAWSGMLLPRLFRSHLCSGRGAVAVRFDNLVSMLRYHFYYPGNLQPYNEELLQVQHMANVDHYSATANHVGVWDDQGRSTNEHEHSSFAIHLILCNTRTTCPCTTPL